METVASQTKKQQRKPTAKQRRAAKLTLENLGSVKPRSQGEIIAEAGYGPGIVKNPKIITESDGYKAALRELGLTEDLVTTALVEDIKEKPKNRVQELTLASKILGMVKTEAPQTPPQNVTYNLIYQPQFQARLKAFEADVKDLMAHGTDQTPQETLGAQ